MGNVSAYFDFCFATLILSLLLNGTLARIAHRRQNRIGFYRYFAFAFVIIDVCYSIAFTVVQPFWYAAPGILAFFSIAPWNDSFTLVRLSLQLWLALFDSVILCITCSFLYRYGLLCRPFLVSMFESPGKRFITSLILIIYGSLWIVNYNYLIFHDSEEVRGRVQHLFGAEFDSHFDHGYMLTVDLNDIEASSRSGAATAFAVVLEQLQLSTMAFCGWRIHKTIKTAVMSDKLKKMHGKALQLLIFQMLNPILFFFAPCFIVIFGMFSNLDVGTVSKPLVHLLAFFPIFNPIIVIYFTDDYKRYLLGRSSTAPQSMTRADTREKHRGANARHFMPI